MTEVQKGVVTAVMTPFFLGLAPIFGKLAMQGGADPFTVSAFRTSLVAILLWLAYSLFWRQYIYIYSAGLIACIAIGFTNGIGSLFYYSGLSLLDASVAQILNATYVIFVIILTRFSGTRISRLVILRMGVALFGVLLITGGLGGQANWLGIGLVLANALLFAGTVVMSQRILYEMPSQTVTLYVMSTMASVVLMARFVVNQDLPHFDHQAWLPILALAVSTMLSRLLLFASVKGVGSLRTALTAVAESAVAISLAFLFLGERLIFIQWVGVGALLFSLLMPTEHYPSEPHISSTGMLPNVAGVWFQRMANTGGKLSTQEIEELITDLGIPPDKLLTQEIEQLSLVLGDDTFEQIKKFRDDSRQSKS